MGTAAGRGGSGAEKSRPGRGKAGDSFRRGRGGGGPQAETVRRTVSAGGARRPRRSRGGLRPDAGGLQGPGAVLLGQLAKPHQHWSRE